MNRSTIFKAIVPIMFMLCSVTPSQAQPSQGSFTFYKEKDGLPGMDVNSVLLDRYGYIWAGTINGIGRFDGYQFQRYYFNPNDSLTVHGLVVWSQFEDRKGHVWIGTSPSYLNRYDPASRSFRQYPFMNLFPGKSGIEVDVAAMAQADNGRMYFGVSTYYGDTTSNALLYLDEGDSVLHRLSSPDGLPIMNFVRMFKGSNGDIWAITYNGILRIDGAGKISYFGDLDGQYEKGEYATGLVVDRSGHMVVVTNRSNLLEYDLNTRAIRRSSIKPCTMEYFSPVVEDGKGGYWIGGLNGLFHFDIRSRQLTKLSMNVDNRESPSVIKSMRLDGFGDLWIGSGKDGLVRYSDRNRLRSYAYQNGAPGTMTSGWVNLLYESSDGKVWASSSGANTMAGLNIIDPRNGSLRPITMASLGLRVNGLSGIWEAGPGKMVLSAYNLGIHEMDLKSLRLNKITLPGVPDSVIVFKRTLDRRGDEWVGTSRGVYRHKKGSEAFKLIDLLKLPGTNLSSITVSLVVDGKEGVWFLTDNGLFLFDPKSEAVTRHGYDRSKGEVFSSQDVNSLYDDGSGSVWVGTWQGGLSRYDVSTGKVTTYTRNDGLPSNSIQGIVPDDKHHSLWLSTFEGISRFDITKGQFTNYSIDDGIQGQLFADASYLRTSGGLVGFGGANGITLFNPDSVTLNSDPPKVFLTDLKLFNKVVLPGRSEILDRSISETDSIVLKYDQNNLTLEYVGIHYSNPILNRYAYKMENYDADWREVGGQRVAYYPSLPPGNYVFRVKSANDKGVWNEKGATLHITILPPWWRTTWAYVLYGLLLALFAFALDRYFRARIVAKERERNQARELAQAREIQKAYDELGRTHESLKSTQTQLVQAEKMASLGELTAGIAHEIQNPLNFVNNFAEINRDLIVEVFDAQSRGDAEEVNALLGDIRDNEGKIRHHGMRADSIVKSMLQHSRASSGQKEPTDLAALAEEYLNLAYHGMRAKDKEFNVTLETDFEPGMPKVNVIPQDIGRVLLNLYNNAFQAVMERKKSGEAGYEPKVRVEVRRDITAETQRRGATAVDSEFGIRNPEFARIAVSDNGSGVPDAIRAKIFQPFFTTKPTGQGTGLGLSLSYDIVSKGHGGSLALESSEAGGARFVIQLPINSGV